MYVGFTKYFHIHTVQVAPSRWVGIPGVINSCDAQVRGTEEVPGAGVPAVRGRRPTLCQQPDREWARSRYKYLHYCLLRSLL